MECVILYRNTSNGQVGYISEDEDQIAVFLDFDAALSQAMLKAALND